jgi:hypothetical protein
VASQLKTFTADGTAIRMVPTANAMPRYGLMPLTNMWCPQTTKLRKPMAHMASTIDLYPKMGRRLKVLRMSEVKPSAGSMRM